MAVILPTQPEAPQQEWDTTLGEQGFIFTLGWSDLVGLWFCSIYSEDREPIARGVPLVSGRLLLGHRVAIPDFPGDIFVDPPEGMTSDPPLTAWRDDGMGYRLVYASRDEL